MQNKRPEDFTTQAVQMTQTAVADYEPVFFPLVIDRAWR